MGGQASRSSEVSQRIVEALDSGHAHTLQLLLKFIQHVPAGVGVSNTSTTAVKSIVPTTPGSFHADLKPTRPVPSLVENLDEAQAAFHARAAALAQQQALAAGLQSASFPIPVDLDQLRCGGEPLLVAAVKKDQPQVLKLFADTGMDLETLDWRGWNALHHAAALRRVGCVNTLLQAHALAACHNLQGLRASQLTPHPDLKVKLEQAEHEDEQRILEMILDATNEPRESHPLFTTSSSQSFPLALYAVECSSEVFAAPGSESVSIDVYFRAPAIRNTADCICLYYVDDLNAPEKMRARLGSVFYLTPQRKSLAQCMPPSLDSSESSSSKNYRALGWDCLTVSLKLASLPFSTYRFVYFDSQRQQVLAASEIFLLKQGSASSAAPSLAPGGRKSSGAAATASPASSPVHGANGADTAAAAPSSSPVSPPSSSFPGMGGGRAPVSSVFSFLPSVPSLLGAFSIAPAPSPSHSLPGSPVPVALHPSFHKLSSGSITRYHQAPPAHFRSHFVLNHDAVKLAIQLDPNLVGFKKRVHESITLRESEFWTRYFWLMSKLEDEEVTPYPKPAAGVASSEQSATAAVASHSFSSAPSTAAASAPVSSSFSASNSSAVPVSSSVPPTAAAVTQPSGPAVSPVAIPAAATASPASSPTASAPSAVASSKPTSPAAAPPKPVVAASAPARASVSMASSRRHGDDSEDSGDESSSYVPPSFAALPVQQASSP